MSDLQLSTDHMSNKKHLPFRAKKTCDTASNRCAFTPFSASELPKEIFQKVVRVFEQERQDLIRDLRLRPYFRLNIVEEDSIEDGVRTVSSVDEDLKSLSLVRRAMTMPAQRALGRVLFLEDTNDKQLKKLLNTPLAGLWTHELVIRQSYNDFRSHPGSSGRKRSVEYLLRLLVKTPNIRLLTWNCNEYFLPEESYIIEKLNTLRLLEELRIVRKFDRTSSIFLGPLAFKINELSALKVLTLCLKHDKNYEDKFDHFQTEIDYYELGAYGLPDGMQRISLSIDRPASATEGFIEWLDPGHSNKLTEFALIVPLSDRINVAKSIKSVNPMLSHLEKLYFRRCSHPRTEAVRPYVEEMVSECKKLRSLSVNDPDGLPPLDFFRLLPGTLRELQISIKVTKSENASTWKPYDSQIVDFISQRLCPNLDRLSLTFFDDGSDLETASMDGSEYLPRTQKACDKSHIAFELIEVFDYCDEFDCEGFPTRM